MPNPNPNQNPGQQREKTDQPDRTQSPGQGGQQDRPDRQRQDFDPNRQQQK